MPLLSFGSNIFLGQRRSGTTENEPGGYEIDSEMNRSKDHTGEQKQDELDKADERNKITKATQRVLPRCWACT
jgi:hypothetical protein